MLTAQQIAHFRTFGFLVFRQLFSAEEMAAITREADALWEEDRRSQSDANGRQAVVPFIEKRPLLARLAEDDRIYQPIAQLLGPGFIWGGSEGNKGNINEQHVHHWHCDRVGEYDLQYTRIKTMIYLVPTTKETGALRVIPGSHRAPLHQDLIPLNQQQDRSCPETFGVAGMELACFPLESTPGDVVMFNQYLFHAVYGSFGARRYVAMKFAERPATEAHFVSLQQHHQDASRLDPVFRHSDRPRIRDMVEGLLR